MNSVIISRRFRIYLGIFMISSSILMLELILTRIFSVKLYYHYAFMVISLALFGSGASGVFIYLFPQIFKAARLEKHLYSCCWLFSFSIPLVLYLILQLDFQLQFSPGMMGRVFLLYSIPAVPFFFGGLCISLAMTHLAERVNQLYFFDLTGAAFGCLMVIPLLNGLGGPEAMLFVSIVAALACFLLVHPNSPFWLRWIPLLVIIPVGAALLISSQQSFLKIKHVKGREESEPLFTKWNSFSRITVVQVNHDPKNTWIIMDGDAGTLLPYFSGDLRKWDFLRTSVSSLAYHIKHDAKTLIIGPGGGIDVLTALVFGNKDITGVEINPITVHQVMQEKFKQFTGGLYERPEVNVIVDEGRSFVRRTNAQYDILQATLVDTWAATAAGAFALTENNLYTVEAFKDYFSKLKPDGVLTFTRWNLEPPQQDLRLVSLTRAAMKEMGISHPERCIIVIRQNRQKEAVECNFLFKKSGFSDEETRAIEAVSRENSLDILYTPLTRPENPFTELITTQHPEEFFARYPFDVSPSTDNRPFFFHTVRLNQIWGSLFLPWESKKTNVGILVLFLVFFVALILVLLFIFAPLYRFQRKELREAPMNGFPKVSYFASLGLGFILVEMTLVQKFILFLGPPVYALSVVLFSMLLFSGLGSFYSSRLREERLVSNVRLVCLYTAALILLYLLVLPSFLYSYVRLPTSLKALLVVGLLMPLSFVMGMPMPLGIQWLRKTSPEIIPWAWGINGSSSVLGSILTILIAVNFGFDQALLSACALYLLAAILVTRRTSVDQTFVPGLLLKSSDLETIQKGASHAAARRHDR